MQLLKISAKWGNGQKQQECSQRYDAYETQILESERSRDAPHDKHRDKTASHAHALPVRMHEHLSRPFAPVPIEQLAELHPHVCDVAGHVGRPGAPARGLGSDGILQTHDERQEQDRERHGEGCVQVEGDRTHETERKHQRSLQHERKRVDAVKAMLAAPVHQYRTDRRPRHERQNGAKGVHQQSGITQHKAIGELRREARHVRGVEMQNQKSPGVDCAGIEREEQPKHAIRRGGPMSVCQEANSSHGCRSRFPNCGRSPCSACHCAASCVISKPPRADKGTGQSTHGQGAIH